MDRRALIFTDTISTFLCAIGVGSLAFTFLVGLIVRPPHIDHALSAAALAVGFAGFWLWVNLAKKRQNWSSARRLLTGLAAIIWPFLVLGVSLYLNWPDA